MYILLCHNWPDLELIRVQLTAAYFSRSRPLTDNFGLQRVRVTMVRCVLLVDRTTWLGGWRFAMATSGEPSVTATGTRVKRWSSADNSTTTTDKVNVMTLLRCESCMLATINIKFWIQYR